MYNVKCIKKLEDERYNEDVYLLRYDDSGYELKELESEILNILRGKNTDVCIYNLEISEKGLIINNDTIEQYKIKQQERIKENQQKEEKIKRFKEERKRQEEERKRQEEERQKQEARKRKEEKEKKRLEEEKKRLKEEKKRLEEEKKRLKEKIEKQKCYILREKDNKYYVLEDIDTEEKMIYVKDEVIDIIENDGEILGLKVNTKTRVIKTINEVLVQIGNYKIIMGRSIKFSIKLSNGLLDLSNIDYSHSYNSKYSLTLYAGTEYNHLYTHKITELGYENDGNVNYIGYINSDSNANKFIKLYDTQKDKVLEIIDIGTNYDSRYVSCTNDRFKRGKYKIKNTNVEVKQIDNYCYKINYNKPRNLEAHEDEWESI